MSEHTFSLPDLGEGLVEATIVEWLVAPGQHVGHNEPLVEVETTKSTVELPSPMAGTVSRLHAEQGAVVAVGAALVSFTGTEARSDAGIVGTVPNDAERPARRVRLRPPEE